MRQYVLSARGGGKLIYFEGDVLHQYKDQAGLWTIGRGHLMNAVEVATGELPGHVQAIRDSQGRWAITEEQSIAIFQVDTGRFAKDLTDLYHGPRELEDHEADALILWDYNTGALASSGVLRALNDGRYGDVPGEILRWNHRRDPRTGNLVVDEGLTLRRQAEVSIWLNGYDHPETDSRLQAADVAETSGRAFAIGFDYQHLFWESDPLHQETDPDVGS
jgi:lysozyme